MRQLEVSYIAYATSFHKTSGDIITFAQFKEGGLLKNERNLVEDESIWIQFMSHLQKITMVTNLQVQIL